MALPDFLTKIVGWLRAGYPEGVPEHDYLPLFALLGGFIYYRSRGSKVDPSNVNAEWTGSVAPTKTPAEPAAV